MSEMLERILSDENIRRAKKRVYANKGAGGVDGVTVQELDEYMSRNWESIKQQIRERKYRPQPVLRVEIPKPNGGRYSSRYSATTATVSDRKGAASRQSESCSNILTRVALG